MSQIVPADLVDAVKERAQEKLRDLFSEVADRQLRPDGTTYGDVALSRGERIERFQDMAERGVLDMLQTVKPDLVGRIHRQYLRDMQGSAFGGE